MILKDAWLFRGTIRENIAYGKEDATEEEITAAAKLASCDTFIRQFKDGYDTVIDEDSLSQGQRQLFGIARGMLTRPPMLILDEATSALDTESERLVQEALERVMKTRTTIAIAHRLSTIKNADQIYVLYEGQIVENGKNEELLAQNGYYQQLNEKKTL